MASSFPRYPACCCVATAATGLVDSCVGDETLSKCGVLTLRFLIEHGFDMNVRSSTASAERENVRDIIEELCYISVNYDTKLNRLTRRRPASSQTETSSLLASTFPLRESVVSAKLTDKGASGIHCFFPRLSVMLISARISTSMSCRQVARPCSK